MPPLLLVRSARSGEAFYFKIYLVKSKIFVIFVYRIKPIIMSSPLIKISKKAKSKIDQAKIILSIMCLLSDIKLSDTELTTLSYFIVYGITEKTKNLILTARILKTEDSLKNAMTKFRKSGLIKKNERKEDLLAEQVRFPISDTTGILIKVDNT
jgi:hypothetical protein